MAEAHEQLKGTTPEGGSSCHASQSCAPVNAILGGCNPEERRHAATRRKEFQLSNVTSGPAQLIEDLLDRAGSKRQGQLIFNQWDLAES